MRTKKELKERKDYLMEMLFEQEYPKEDNNEISQFVQEIRWLNWVLQPRKKKKIDVSKIRKLSEFVESEDEKPDKLETPA